MRRAEPVAVAGRSRAGALPVTALYDVVLLAGRPRRVTLRLAADIDREAVIEVDGEAWMIADVRPAEQGPSQLICIYAE